jgi:hypothetical protein
MPGGDAFHAFHSTR